MFCENSMKKVSIIVPCFNEKDVINIFYDELLKHLPSTYEFILIFVDDDLKIILEIIQDLEKLDKL